MTQSETLDQFVQSLKSGQPGKAAEIDAAVADFRMQSEGGGISVEEVKGTLLTLFPRQIENVQRRTSRRLKGRNTKR